MLTEQELFDKAVEHATKGEKCGVYDESGVLISCKYRNDKGQKCFIGAVIPDELYDSSIEGLPGSVVLQKYKLMSDQYCTETLLAGNLADKLQKIHDEYAPHHWGYMLVELAKWRNLTINQEHLAKLKAIGHTEPVC